LNAPGWRLLDGFKLAQLAFGHESLITFGCNRDAHLIVGACVYELGQVDDIHMNVAVPDLLLPLFIYLFSLSFPAQVAPGRA
jgi:hypothetical protein